MKVIRDGKSVHWSDSVLSMYRLWSLYRMGYLTLDEASCVARQCWVTLGRQYRVAQVLTLFDVSKDAIVTSPQDQTR